MSDRERFLIGGIGGLAPVLMFFATVDFDRLIGKPSAFWGLGYGMRATILFFIGGFVVSLYRDENMRIKVFQLGLGAPAMIAGFIAAQTPHQVASLFHPVPTVQAAVEDPTPQLKQFEPQSVADQFVEGLTGYRKAGPWFVIAAVYPSSTVAYQAAYSINVRFRDEFHADVYQPPSPDNPIFSVVIGAYMTQDGAYQLWRTAVATEQLPNCFVWNYPDYWRATPF